MRAETVVSARPAAVLDVLVDAAAAPAWNPAFTSITPPDRSVSTGRDYHALIRGVLRARLRFSVISPTMISYRLSALGSTENGSWHLTPVAGGTRVVHEFEHRGGILALMRGAFENVAELRVERLRREFFA